SGIFVKIQVAAHAQVDIADADGRAGRDLHVTARQPERLRHMQRDVESQPLPWIQRLHGVDTGYLHLFGRVRLEERPVENGFDLHGAAADRDSAGRAGRIELSAQAQCRVELDLTKIVVQDL